MLNKFLAQNENWITIWVNALFNGFSSLDFKERKLFLGSIIRWNTLFRGKNFLTKSLLMSSSYSSTSCNAMVCCKKKYFFWINPLKSGSKELNGKSFFRSKAKVNRLSNGLVFSLMSVPNKWFLCALIVWALSC